MTMAGGRMPSSPFLLGARWASSAPEGAPTPASGGTPPKPPDLPAASGKKSEGRLSLKETLKEYGAAAIAVHSVVYVGTFSVVLVAVVAAKDHVAWILVEAEKFTDADLTHAGPLLATYLVTMITGPLRGLLTIITAPFAARKLASVALWQRLFPPRKPK